ncbi:MerR family transcriptional regulator [Chengkuizengella axinellae]|uniref:MerR family transcriptional regulator n=1 Tax=Chengkuizengella axinellae TaxID=3064388 RepID=A0ABT9J4M9_9BACL|nr:MerR family transcriptional regulator [Chengkuizengella sp. 2205SS18-9]MDP5276528.1 MerR family transcriptional regulator [Chengkuizengella sp. 2205SS18-9]
MKIGELSKKNKISIDSIRHYMEMGLIIAEKKGGKYHFEETCNQDIKDILYFKKMGFTLNEIQMIFRYKRLGILSPFQQYEYYRTLFDDKYKEIENKIKKLEETKEYLESEIQKNKNQRKKRTKLGIPLASLSMLVCHKCQGNLNVKNAGIENNQILNGSLTCSCGNSYFIEEGILCTVEVYEKIKEKKKNGELITSLDFSISDFIQKVDGNLIDQFYKCIVWLNKKINHNELHLKILLEIGTGVGIFLRHIYEVIPEDCSYIAVDHDYEQLYFVKNILETSDQMKNVLLICSDFLQVPIKNKSVDYLFDVGGTTNYSFDHEPFLLAEIDHYLKAQSNIFGSYILFENFVDKSQVHRLKQRDLFTLSEVNTRMESLNYIKMDEVIFDDEIKPEEEYESYFTNGEKVFFYNYYARREIK